MTKSDGFLVQSLRKVVMALAAFSGAALLAMILVTCADIAIRPFKMSIKGTVDLVGMLGAVTMACALPYTTAIKGHVAVEFFFLKLGPRGRMVVDTLARLVVIAFFAVLSWRSVAYGNSLRAAHEVSPTLEMPIFWVPWFIGGSCALVICVKIYHLLNPGKSLIKP
jgi:TRAP-type C4-dicarboxylate transport system permease small subunit